MTAPEVRAEDLREPLARALIALNDKRPDAWESADTDKADALRCADELLVSLVPNLEQLFRAVASWQYLWESKEEWEQAATASWTRSDALSGLLRGMARRVGAVRQSLRFADAHVPEWERVISEHKAEIARLTDERDEWKLAAETEAELLDQEQAERRAAKPRPHEAVVENAVANALNDTYGFVPLDVRYEAARSARGLVEQWLNPPTPEGKPSPWFTPAEFPIEQHEAAEREHAFGGPDRDKLLALWRDAASAEPVDLQSLTGTAEFDAMFPPEAEPLTAGELDAATERVKHDDACPGHLVGVTCTSCCNGEHVRGHLCAGCGWWDV